MENTLKSGALYVVGTPIGNLSDISKRATETLTNADHIACEDTRVTGKLLNLLGISHKNSFISYHEHNKFESAKGIVEKLQSGFTVALVSDAGMPAISDPGEDLVKICKQNDICVIPVPSASAFTAALCASGFDSRRFCFEGFLPTDKKEISEVLDSYKNNKRTVIFYEAPHRLLKTLEVLLKHLGNRKLCIARELTKINEEIYITTLENAVNEYKERNPKGEYVLIIEGAKESDKDNFFENMTINEHVEFYSSKGLSKMDAIKACAKDRGVAKNEIYKEFI